jgi:hypothetical protein
MRVYKINCDLRFQRIYFFDQTLFTWKKRPGKPKEPNFGIGPNYDNPMLKFDGERKGAKWSAPKVFSVCEGPDHLVPNIWGIGNDAFGLDVLASEKLGPMLDNYGEMLPLQYEEQPVKLFHITRIVDCLDKSLSDGIFKFAFFKDRLIDANLFKIAQRRVSSFTVERTGDPKTEFKAAVEHYGLTGLIFLPVWDSATGMILRTPSAPVAKEKPARKTPALREEPLDDAIRKEICSCVADGYKLLEIGPRSKADRVQKAIQAWIERFREKKRRSAKAVEDAALYLGCLWGQTVCDELGWEWAALKEGQRTHYGIVSPKRESVALPTLHFRALLKNSAEEVNTLLLYNMIKAGEMTSTAPNSYQVIR